MTSRVTLIAAAILLASDAFGQDRLFLARTEVGASDHFGEVVGPSHPILDFPRVGGHRFAVTHDAVVDLARGATLPRPPGFIVAYDQARPRVFISRDDGVWAVDVVSAEEVRVLARQPAGMMGCRHATSADLLVCAYTRDDGQFDIYRSTSGEAAHLATLRRLDPSAILGGEQWVVTPDGTRTYAMECSRPLSSSTFCFGGRLVAVDVETGTVERAASEFEFLGDLPTLVLDEVRDRVLVTAGGDAAVFAADLRLLAATRRQGVNPQSQALVSPHTDTIYWQTHVQSTYGSVSWLSSLRADSYATILAPKPLPYFGSRMQLVTVPGAPRNLRADVAGRNVTLNWTNIGAASDFVVDVGLTPGRTALSLPVAGGDPRASFNDVPPGTYYVRVRGGNLIGGGRASQEIAVTVQ